MTNPEAVSTVEIAEAAEQAVASSEEAGQKKSDERPSILFCCPGSVLDTTSGAAVSLRTILEALAARGFRTVALQSTIFDSPDGGSHILEAGKQQPDKPIWRTVMEGVEHLIVRTRAPQRRFMNCQEEETYMNLVRGEFSFRKPDAVFLWGGLVLERTIMREARDLGIPVAFYLVNPGYKDKSVFKDVSVILTDTKATAALYKERHGFDCKVVGKFIHPDDVRPKVPRKPDYITFINPSFEKGVSVFMPLAKLAQRVCPEVKFLVVQSRGKWGNALEVLKYKPDEFPNVGLVDHQKDMRRVYASTRAVLLPSLWHESGARVIVESHLNGIPVLASNTGGSAELIGKGGRVFDLPEDVREKRDEAVVKEEDLLPWLEEIKRIWHDEQYYQDLCAVVTAEARRHDMEYSVRRFVKAIADCPPAHSSPDMTNLQRWALQHPAEQTGDSDFAAALTAAIA